MPRTKSNIKKVRKHYELPLKHASMIDQLRTMLEMGSETEVLRHAISQCFHLENAIKEGCWIVIRDKEGQDRAFIFK